MSTLRRTINRNTFRNLIVPFTRFAELESLGSILLLLAAATAFIMANSPLRGIYETAVNTPIIVTFGDVSTSSTLRLIVNDGLMSLFFLVVGMEIKRELLIGELASARYALLPVLAAAGGVIMPATIYLILNRHSPASAGWGIPIATDITFSLAVLSMLGSRVPAVLKVFLTTLAIADDIAGVIVIAIAYTHTLHFGYLASAVLITLSCALLSRIGVTRLSVYVIAGPVLWYMVRGSGVHAALAGILLALVIPAKSGISTESFLDRGRVRIEEIAKSALGNRSNSMARRHLHSMRSGMNQYEPPLDRLQRNLHPWVSFGVVPLFALTNAGIPLSNLHIQTITDPLFLGVLLGLLFGKPLGISLFSWMAVRSHLAALPRGVSWAQLHGISWLGGIGFTISIFVSGLAFQQNAEDTVARIAVVCASTLAAIVGIFLLIRGTNKIHPDST